MEENNEPVICNHPGCDTPGMACYLPANEYTDWVVSEYYCGEHAPHNGYCAGCGMFWAGIESFDMNPAGLCDDCQREADHRDEDYQGPDELVYFDEFAPFDEDDWHEALRALGKATSI